MSNLDLWNRVKATDPAYVKTVNMRGGFSSIAPQYQIQCATEQFGPYGKGWGFQSCEFDYSQLAVTRLVLVSAVFFYVIDGERHTFPINNSWPVMSKKDVVDDDFAKKAETNTMSKALSKIGFSADIFMGEFDNPDYVKAVGNDFALENAEDQIEERAAQQKEYEDWADGVTKLLKSASSINELKQVFKGAAGKAKLYDDSALIVKFNKIKDDRKIQLEANKGNS